MRLISIISFIVWLNPGLHAQPVKSKRVPFTCETLCAELFASIRANPEKMVMRLEEALVIKESCAAEIVTAAIDAVNADPAMVRKIVQTATDVSPRKASMIAMAVKHYAAPIHVVSAKEEIRRAEPSSLVRPQALPGEELRRAEMPLMNQSIPIIEIRRATVPSVAAQVRITQKQNESYNLSQVPKAVALDEARRK